MQKKVTLVNLYDVFASKDGGSLYVTNFLKSLSSWFEINIVMIIKSKYYIDSFKVSENVTAYYILPGNLDEMQKTSNGWEWKEYIMSFLWQDEYALSKLREIGKDSDMIIAEHAYVWNYVKNAFTNKLLIYKAQNVEYDYCRMLWDKIPGYEKVIDLVFNVEQEACKGADYIFTISNEEKERFCDIYDINSNKKKYFIILGASIDYTGIRFVKPSERDNKSNVEKGFYIASSTPATRRVVQRCIKSAKLNPSVKYIVAGNVCKDFFDIEDITDIQFVGVISDEEKYRYLNECSFAINIVDDGAGVNIKMFEYFAAGIPVVASKHGVRGIEAKDKEHCIIIKEDELDIIADVLNAVTTEKRDEIATNAKKLLDDRYSWNRLVWNAIEKIFQDIKFIDVIKENVCFYDWREIKTVCEYVSEYEFDKPVFIRGAGIRGKRCKSILDTINVDISGFLDMNSNTSMLIEGCKVFSPGILYSNYNGEYIIVAIQNNASIVKELIDNRIPIENILIFEMNLLIPLKNGERFCPPYYDYEKIVRLSGDI